MQEQISKPALITKDTYVSIAVLCSIIGGVVWLTTMYADIGYLKQTIAELKTNIQAQITEIKSDIKEIKQLITQK